MNHNELLLLVGGFIVGWGIMSFFYLQPVDSAIPPTRAFSHITIAGQNINATSYSSSFEIITLGNLTTSVSGNAISFKLKEFSCPALETITGIDDDGNWICE